MVEVPSNEEFQALVKRVEKVEEENAFLLSLLFAERWLSRQQAMVALNCKDNKLRELTLGNKLTYRYEGKRPYYDASSIRDYLTYQKIESKVADRRIISARYTK
ncbi:hypothetical protein GCM10028808_10400 [Spirosoma migulaei]